MKTNRSWTTRLFALLFAATAATSAVAQDPRGGGPGGPGGPGAGAAPLAMLLLDPQVAAALALTAAQLAQWTALDAAEQAAHAQQDGARTTLQAYVSAQFASGAPDLVAIENAVVAQHKAMADAAAATGALAGGLYASLDTGQQALVVGAAVARYPQVRPR